MTQALSAEELSAIALFPLPRVVLLPGTTVPLHVFEPRYRAMIADCLERQRMSLVVVQLKPGYEASYQQSPEIHRVGGAGRITACRRSQGGTYDIEVSCLARVALQELPPSDRGYRRACASVLPDTLDGGPPDALELSSLWSLASQVTALVRERRGVPVRLLGKARDPAPRLVDVIADQLVADPALRQTLLETQDVRARLALTKTHLAKLQLSLLHAAKDGPTTLH